MEVKLGVSPFEFEYKVLVWRFESSNGISRENLQDSRTLASLFLSKRLCLETFWIRTARMTDYLFSDMLQLKTAVSDRVCPSLNQSFNDSVLDDKREEAPWLSFSQSLSNPAQNRPKQLVSGQLRRSGCLTSKTH